MLPPRGGTTWPIFLFTAAAPSTLVRPVSPLGVAWVDQHISPDATWFGGAVVVEHRYIRDIGIIDDGLEVQ